MQAKVRGTEPTHEWRRYVINHKFGTYSRPVSFHITSKEIEAMQEFEVVPRKIMRILDVVVAVQEART